MIRNVLPPFLWFTAENLVETNSFISRIRVGVLFWCDVFSKEVDFYL